MSKKKNNRKKFIKNLKKNFDDVYEVLQCKTHDYADKNDPFKNFTLCEKMFDIPIEAGMLVRMGDKISRLGNLIKKKNKVKGETKLDTLMDIMGYANLWLTYVQMEEKKK